MMSSDLVRYSELQRLSKDLQTAAFILRLLPDKFYRLMIPVGGEDAKILAAMGRTAKRLDDLDNLVFDEMDRMEAAVDGHPLPTLSDDEMDRIALQRAREIIDRELEEVRE